MQADVIISERIAGAAITQLARDFRVGTDGELWRTPERLRAAVTGCRALIVRNQTPVTSDPVAAAPHREIIGGAGAGLENIDVPAATAAGVVVANPPEENSISVAEFPSHVLESALAGADIGIS